MKKYLPKQMNGPVITAYADATTAEFSDTEAIIEYLHNLSINSAQKTEIENIGKLIGYPRPVVPSGFNSENLLVLGTLPLETNELNGLSKIGSAIGGRMGSLQPDENSNFMDLGLYKQFLEKIALIKRYGLTIKSIDQIAALVSNDYDIEYDENWDIELRFHNLIGFKFTWLLTQLFYRVATAPQVIIYSGV